mgnify:CR=1 FL=1
MPLTVSETWTPTRAEGRGRTFCDVLDQPELDAVSDVDQRVDGSTDRTDKHLPIAAEKVPLEDGDGARWAPSVRARRRRWRRDEAVEEGEVVGVVPAGSRSISLGPVMRVARTRRTAHRPSARSSSPR